MSNEKANIRSGASVLYTEIFLCAIFAVLQGLETSEMPSKIKTKIKQKKNPASQSASKAVACYQSCGILQQ